MNQPGAALANEGRNGSFRLGELDDTKSLHPDARPEPGCCRTCQRQERKRNLLFIGQSKGYQHESISTAMVTLFNLGRSSKKWDTVFRTDCTAITKKPLKYGAKNLDAFDAVAFFTDGNLDMDESQKADLLSFIRDDGKGFIGIHSATITFVSWPDYGKMIGGYFDGHPWGTFDAPLIVEDVGFPGMKHLPRQFTLNDEIYQIKDFSRDNVRVLMSLDTSKLDLSKPGVRRKDFPVAWARNYGKGRVLYNGLGHTQTAWDRPEIQKMWLEMVQWSMGLIPGDASPQVEPKAEAPITVGGGALEPSQSPDMNLPPHISRLSLFGERHDFSRDGKKILFLEKTFGDVYEIDTATKMPRLLTGHFAHAGFTRALYLSNGDILLSGPEHFDSKNPAASRVQCHLSILDKSLTKPPVPLGTKCSEGPAVSRSRMHIAWTHVAQQYPDEMPQGSSRIHEADIVSEGGVPKLANARVVLDSRDLPFRCTLECQNFRPGNERELTFSAYGYNGTDVCGIDLDTKKVVNYSDSPGQYDEPEGIFPDGLSTLVECDRECRTGRGPATSTSGSCLSTARRPGSASPISTTIPATRLQIPSSVTTAS